MRSRRMGRNVLAGDFGHGDHAAHRAHVRQLRQAGHDVADGEDARLGRLLGFVDLDEPAVELDAGLLDADVRCLPGARPTATSTFSASLTWVLPLASVKVTLTPASVFFDLLDFGAGVDVDAALLEEARDLLGDLFVLDRNHARQKFEDGDFGAEAAEDARRTPCPPRPRR